MQGKFNDETKDSMEVGWNFDNSYIALPELFYSKININTVKSPKLVTLNEELCSQLGLSIKGLKSREGVEMLAGNRIIKGGAYIAQAYAGHQFGHFTMLGDGRALLIGEQITQDEKRYDIQLKGAGRTPYSRGGDGRAVLGPMIREYIISEAMNGLRIPTTRSLAVVKTGESVIREKVEDGAILTRIASSHIRFGTFQYVAEYGDINELKELADYCIERHYPKISNDNNKYINLLKEVIKVHAKLVSKWQGVGFIHGVMNTDNMTISGETIDYGPCAFMDTYDPNTVFSSIDVNGRYAYKNQPKITQWNLCRLAEVLVPLFHNNRDEGIKIAQSAIDEFTYIYYLSWLSIMRAKLGIFNEEPQDKVIIENLLDLMKTYKEDFTNTFRMLTISSINREEGMFKSEEFKNWYKLWTERLERQSKSKADINKLMRDNNPSIIPRNHRVEEAIVTANNGDFNVMEQLLEVLKNPYEYSIIQEDYSKLPERVNSKYRTFCGT